METTEKVLRYSLDKFICDLEYDLALKVDCAEKSDAYKIALLKIMIQDARDTVKDFRKREHIECETADDFDTHPLTII